MTVEPDWEALFAQFVASLEEYAGLELPAGASSHERYLQLEIRKHLHQYKEATRKEKGH